MVRKDGAEIRKERMENMAKEIQRKLHTHGEIPLRQSVAFFAYDLGLTKPKIMEYLEILEELGQFVLDEEKDRIRKVTQEERNIES